MSELQVAPPSQVYVDKIPPEQAPAAIGSATAEQAQKKQQAVIENIQKRAEDITPYVSTQPSPENIQGQIRSTDETIQGARDTITKLNQPGILDRIPGIGAVVSKIKEGQIRTATTTIEQAQATKTQAQADLDTAQMYTKEYLEKKSDPNRVKELIEANEKGGPMAVSYEMTQALREQGDFKSEINFYKEKRIEIDLDKMLPLQVYREMKRKVDTDFNNMPEKVDQKILAMSAFNEIALEYADSHGIQVDESKFAQAFFQGQTIHTAIYSRESRDFIARHGGNVEWTGNSATWYVFGGTQLEAFFRRNNIPDGEERIPYIIAYGAGVAEYGVPVFQAHSLRDWIAESIPYEQSHRVRKDGQ